MKKNRLRKFIWTAIVLLFFVGGLIYFAYQQAFDVPRNVIAKLRSGLQEKAQVDFDSAFIRVNVSQHAIRAKDLRLMVPGQKPFLEVDKAQAFLASGTGPLDLYHSRAVVERIQIQELMLDLDAFFPKPQGNRRGLNDLPFGEIDISGLTVKSNQINIPAPEFHGKLLRSGSSANLYCDFGPGFFGGKIKLLATIDMISGATKARLSWHKENFANFFPFMLLSHFYGLNIKSGGLQLTLHWTGNLNSFANLSAEKLLKIFRDEFVGSISLQDLAIGWRKLAAKLNANLLKEREAEPWSIDLELLSDVSSVNLAGTWQRSQDGKNFLNAELLGDKLILCDDLRMLIKPYFSYPMLETAQVNVKSKLAINGSEHSLSGALDSEDLRIFDKNISVSSLQFDVQSNVSASFSLDIASEDMTGQAELEFSLAEDCYLTGAYNASIAEVDMSWIGKLTGFDLSGKLTASCSGNIDILSLQKTSYHADINLSDFGAYGFKADELAFKLVGEGESWTVLNPEALFPCGGHAKIDGTLSSNLINGKIDLSEVSLQSFGVPLHIVSGFASMKGAIDGNPANPVLSGEVWGENIGLFSLDLPIVRSQISIKNGILELSPLSIKATSQSFIDGYYSINLTTGKTVSFSVSFQKLPINLLHPVLPPFISDIDEKSFIGGNINFEDRNGIDSWKFLVDGYQLSVGDQKIDSIYVEGNILGDQGEVKKLFARTAGGTLSFAGEFIDLQTFHGLLDLDSIKLDHIPALSEYLPRTQGELSCSGEIQWEKDSREGRFTIFLKDLKSNGRDVGNFGGEVSLDEKGLQIESGEFDRLGVRFDGKMDFQKNFPYKAEVILDNVDFSFITEAHGIKTFEPNGLIVNGHCSIQGDANSYLPDNVDLYIDSLKIQKDNDVIVSNKPVHILYQNEGIEIRSLELKYRLGILGFEGIINPRQSIALMVNGKDFSVQALGRLFDLPNWGYDGSLSVNARVFGDVRDIKLKASANIDDFEVMGKKIPGVWASVEGDKERIVIEDARVSLPNSSFNLKGNVDLIENFQPGNIDLHLFVPESSLKDIPSYFPEIVKEASGTVVADLNLTGKPFSPRIVGELKLAADKIGFSSMKKPLNNVNFAVSTEDFIVNIDQLSAELGRGKLFGEGSIDFRDNLGSISARISGEKLDISFLNLDVNNASAAFSIAGDLYNPIIDGKVFIPRGKFNLTTDIFSKKRPFDLFFDTMNYNIDFEIPRNFWIKSSFLNAEMKGRFSLSGDLENPRLEGGVSCIQGNLFFQQRRFRVDTGEIKFGGVEDSFDPHIFVKSEGQIQSTKIFLTLQGRVSSFTPSIYSTPPMSEGDLLAMLTLGRGLTSSTHPDHKEPFEKEVLDGLKNSYISALIGQTISSALNLDELFLSSLQDRTSGKSRAFIRVGKYISNNIFMAYEGTMHEGDEETYIFEYRLPRGFVVNLEFKEPKKEQRIGVRYDWTFW